jgi:hypothetical protein
MNLKEYVKLGFLDLSDRKIEIIEELISTSKGEIEDFSIYLSLNENKLFKPLYEIYQSNEQPDKIINLIKEYNNI